MIDVLLDFIFISLEGYEVHMTKVINVDFFSSWDFSYLFCLMQVIKSWLSIFWTILGILTNLMFYTINNTISIVLNKIDLFENY